MAVLSLFLALVAPAAPAAAQEEARRGAPADAEAGTPAAAGLWEGVLRVPGTGAELRLVLRIEEGEGGALSATLDSPDQGATGIPVSGIGLAGDTLRVDVSAVGGSYEGRFEAPDRIAGTWRQSGAALPLELRRVEAVRGPERPQEPEAPFPYRAEEVRYPNPEAGIELAGTLTLPDGEGPFPAVLLLSGSGPQDRDGTVFGHRPFLVLADHLTRRGIAVLRADDRGVGESGGSFAEATSGDFASDARAGLAYLKRRPEIDPRAVGLVGHSEGGIVASMVASRSDEVAFLVLLGAPGLPGEELLYLQGAAIARAMGASERQLEAQREQQAELFRIVREEEDPETRLDRLKASLRERLRAIGQAERAAAGIPGDSAGREAWLEAQLSAAASPWFRFFLTHDPREDLRRVRAPVLALIGGLDLQVPPAENLPEIEAALVRGGNRDVTALELEGLNHLLQRAGTGSPAEYAAIEQTMAPEAMEAVTQWILARADSSTAGSSEELPPVPRLEARPGGRPPSAPGRPRRRDPTNTKGDAA